MAWGDVRIRNAKPKEKPYKLEDRGGLFLLVTPAGGKLWRFKFRVVGKEKLLSLGGWPEVTLANARKERDKAWESVATGADPAKSAVFSPGQDLNGAWGEVRVCANPVRRVPNPAGGPFQCAWDSSPMSLGHTRD